MAYSENSVNVHISIFPPLIVKLLSLVKKSVGNKSLAKIPYRISCQNTPDIITLQKRLGVLRYDLSGSLLRPYFWDIIESMILILN